MTTQESPLATASRASCCQDAQKARTALCVDGHEPVNVKASGLRPRVSLCMIVRDNAETIRPALESIRPWVDEMIVVDTGSTDETPDLCRELGARVEQFAWCDDFAAARNASLKYASGEWIFWMDSDDTIPAECGRGLRALVDGDHDPRVFGYVMQVHCPSVRDPDGLTVVDHVKLFRNRDDLRFEHRIHEQIQPAIRRAGGQTAFTELFVVHSGSDRTTDGRRRKLERDYRLLKLDLHDRPDHPFVLFNLGMTYNDDGRHSLALNYLERCLQVSQPRESHLRKAYALLVASLGQLGRTEDALQRSREGLELFPDDVELRFHLAAKLHELDRLEEAAESYQQLLKHQGERYLTSCDPGLAGFKSRHNLGIVYRDLDRPHDARREWQRVTRERPNFRPAWRGLAELAFAENDSSFIDALIDELRGHSTLSVEALILEAHRAERRGDLSAARHALDQAKADFPEEAEPLRELGRYLFHHEGPAAAESVLWALSQREPGDAAVWHNLGSILLATNRPAEAVPVLENSLLLRRNSQGTRWLLAQALRRCGRTEESKQALKQTDRPRIPAAEQLEPIPQAV